MVTRSRGDRAAFRELFDPMRFGRAMVRHGVRPAILAVLAKQPMHGYQVMQELEQLSGGRWRPSAGSVYPILQQLEDEGLVRSRELDGRRVYTLTDEGRVAADKSPLKKHPFFDGRGGTPSMDLRRLAVQLIGGAIQVSRVGSDEAQAQAREILIDARRRMYGLLAEDDMEPSGAASVGKEPVQ